MTTGEKLQVLFDAALQRQSVGDTAGVGLVKQEFARLLACLREEVESEPLPILAESLAKVEAQYRRAAESLFGPLPPVPAPSGRFALARRKARVWVRRTATQAERFALRARVVLVEKMREIEAFFYPRVTP